MRFLVDNNVPRSVTTLFDDRGHDALEVREALGQDAPDDIVAAYAASQHRIVVTHDRGLARRSARLQIQHLWLRTREPQDRDRLSEALPTILAAFGRGAMRVVVFASVMQIDPTRRPRTIQPTSS